MSKSGNVVEDHRRKWDHDEYERQALERMVKEELGSLESGKKEAPVKRDLLRPRDYRVDLESKLGKSQVITKTTPSSHQGGEQNNTNFWDYWVYHTNPLYFPTSQRFRRYFCNVCDCVVKDSINFLDHINGKKHQRNLGMSMKVERSSLEQVKKRFEMNKKKMEDKSKNYDFEERVQELQEEEEKQRNYRREKKKDRKRKATEPDLEIDPDVAAMMGFGGFGGKKKN